MVQLRYFGDSRDYFKYDLIAFVLQDMEIENYVFVPMLTKDRGGNEGNRRPQDDGSKSKELLSSIESCVSKDLNHWETWLKKKSVKSYETVQAVNKTYFDDAQRTEYWKQFSPLLARENALIFIDPDTGLESGKPSYLRRMGREKYILNDEAKNLYEHLDRSSILMIYQHLPNNKHWHIKSVEKKLSQIFSATGGSLTCAYREDDLAFIFIAKEKGLFKNICETLVKYHNNSKHRYKSIHLSSKGNGALLISQACRNRQ